MHEMLHGEPPFGYGGHELPRRIAAGLPKDAQEATGTMPGGDSPHCAKNAPTVGSDTNGSTDQGNFLPIVRCGIIYSLYEVHFGGYFGTNISRPSGTAVTTGTWSRGISCSPVAFPCCKVWIVLEGFPTTTVQDM